MSKFVCSICGKEPKPKKLSQGIWRCECFYDHEFIWKSPKLVPDEKTVAALSPVTDNPDEEAFYDKLDRMGK